MMKMKRLSLMLLAMLMVISVAVPVSFADDSRTFKDLPSTHWAHSAIMNMTNQGLLSGYPDGTFGSNRTMTRAEFTAVVVRILNLKGNQMPFTDVPRSHWGYSGIAAASEAGIIVQRDYGSTFEPNVPITRLEMAKMLARGLATKEESYAAYLDAFSDLYNGDLPFVDYRDFNQSDVPYLAMAFGSGIMSGYPDVSFGQDRAATRAEAAVMLSSFMRMLKVNPEDVQYLNELKEVAEIGMNATSVSELIPEVDLTLGETVIDHWMFTAKLKRAYVVPNKSDVVSMYEQKYVWDRTEIYEQRLEDDDGWVIGVADVTFHQDLGSVYDWSRHLYLSPAMSFFYDEPHHRFGLIYSTLNHQIEFKKGETYEITFYARYNENNVNIDFRTSVPKLESEFHPILYYTPKQ